MNKQTRYGAVAAGLSLFAGISVAGCGADTNQRGSTVTLSSSPKPLTKEQTEIRSQIQEGGMSKGEVDFAFDLLQKESAKSPGTNTFLSSFSASQALLLAANGTTGDTQRKFLKSIGLPPLDIQTVDEQKKELLALLEPASEKDKDGKQTPLYEWNVANAIWSRYEPKPHFVEYCGNYFNAQASRLTDAATINQWADTNTRGRIKSIVTEPMVAQMDLILTNAVYFKGTWVKPFKENATQDAPFHLPDGKTRTQPLMRDTSQGMQWYDGANYEAVSLPYKGNMSMVVILPDAGTTPQKVVASLSATEWTKLQKGWKPSWIELALPKFEIDYSTSLLKSLKELGMPTTGNFSPINDKFVNQSISDVIQKTFLRVDEKGTEAAAVTAIMMPTSARPPQQGKPHPFIVDRPFLCAIVHNGTGTILFSGIINDPKPPQK